MLPEGTKAQAATKVKEQLHQTNVDNHFKPANPEDKKPVYSHVLLREAAVFKHFVKNWPLEQQKEVDIMVKKVVCDFT